MRTRPPLLLLVVLVPLLSTSRADDDSTTVTFPLPSGCPKTCGNITFEYPFGVGHGCFRPGFELTCVSTSDPHKLLLGNGSSIVEVVQNINVGSDSSSFVVNTPVVAVMDVNDYSSQAFWRAPTSAPYFISPDDGNQLVVIGCSAEGSLVDLTTNHMVANCSTTCLNGGVHLRNDSLQSGSCKGVGCCTVQMDGTLRSYRIRLSRINETVARVSTVNAYITWFDHDSGVSDGTVVVDWTIGDSQTCEEAQKETKTYACRGGSSCFDKSNGNTYPGYYCSCPDHTYQGNPYVPYGCDDPSTTVIPSNNCSTKCGNVSILFPFGLEEGCYRDKTFALVCDENSNPPALSYKNVALGRINDIMVDEGKIEFVASGAQLADNGNGLSDDFYQPDASNSFGLLQGHVIYNWAIFESRSCMEAQVQSSKFACRSNASKCVDTNITKFGSQDPDEEFFSGPGSGYICRCLDGYEGNPYLAQGCTDINECHNPEKYVCYGNCVNTPGSYICNCPPKTQGDPKKGPCISQNKSSKLLLGAIIGLSVALGTLLLFMITALAKKKWDKIKQKRIRQGHFIENHGLLLQQLIAANEDATDNVKIFSLEDLEKATNKFDSSRILGQGGHGTVYKGILSNQHIVAIKRSKIKEKTEIDEFLNEVTILSQINHRNIVKLFRCCLETEVPLLVYEFISNGTLFHHLYSPENKSTLSWKDRLRIAAEAARALEYLHSSTSLSIFHRDMKSSNILLDDYLTAKVSDFGASRLIPHNQTHIVTTIQGTYGYLDPEYYQTSQLTEKSDVYSFGVVLLELLTGKKPISFDHNEEDKNLITQFLQALSEHRHFELMEGRVMVEGTTDELDKVARLAEMCLKIKGSERPTMTEVEVQLRCLHNSKQQTREKEVANGQEEMMPLRRNTSHSPNVQSLSEQTRIFSLEREMISSMRQPR